uniref:NADH dehydrogenase subunit 6 n=1 Tax=Tigriopus californicus TaxID=6832 RepID=A2T4Y8_TIGCA|nr:NADH dehydrogenase subunit 6 [Tigriopus californicus]ABI33100.1 NADH dehydrogenase subunit 6 [Tigriopus californicus]
MTSYSLTLVVYSVSLVVGLKNPFSFSLYLVYLSIVGGLSLGVWVSAWSFYVIVLIFVGGMMVMLLYVSTFSGDPKIKMNMSAGLSLGFMCLLLPFSFPYVGSWGVGKIEILGVYSQGGGPTLLSAIYLLVILLFIVKLSESFKGSLMLASL